MPPRVIVQTRQHHIILGPACGGTPWESLLVALGLNGVGDPHLAAMKKPMQFTKDLCELAVYCKAVPVSKTAIAAVEAFSAADETSFDQMSSFSEAKAAQLMLHAGRQKAFQWRHVRRLARVYPKASRADSSNPNPSPFWSCGVQMAALNFQTGDRGAQINGGFFRQNGGCGYVLKPEYMIDGCFDPRQKSAGMADAIHLRVAVLAGRHLAGGVGRAAEGEVFVRVEVVGCPPDCALGVTSVVKGALNPAWDETFDFGLVRAPALAVLRLAAYQHGYRNRPVLLGQSTTPICALRAGYRSAALTNSFGEVEDGLRVILVHVEREAVAADEDRAVVRKLLDVWKDKRQREGTVRV